MKGVLFSVLEEVVVPRYGEDAWDDILAAARVDGAYTSLGDYPEADLTAIVTAVAGHLGVSIDDVLVLGGRAGFPVLVERHPTLVEEFADWRTLLHALDGIIHPEVHKIYPGSQVPTFSAEDTDDGVRLTYRSARRLCRLAEGLVLGTADHFGAAVDVTHESCTQRGDATCVLLVADAG